MACCKGLCCALVMAGIIGLIAGSYVPPFMTRDTVPDDDPLAALRQFYQNWGYVDVRPGAHKFYWLFNTTHYGGPNNRPLIMWLQGGPGASSTRHGLFEIIGPLDTDFLPREHSWISEANLLFVDHPVGAGFSYVDSDEDFTTTMQEDADDLLELFRVFLQRHPGFRASPLYVFGQSYGGKMGAVFVQRLYQAVEQGDIDCNLAGLALGNSWISPENFTMTWGNFLYWMSFLDEVSRDKVNAATLKVQDAIHRGDWRNASELWSDAQWTLIGLAPVDFYNVMDLKEKRYGERSARHTWPEPRDVLLPPYPPGDVSDEVMGSLVMEFLNISMPVGKTFGGQFRQVFRNHAEDFLRPVVHIVDDLLKNTDLDVIVYQGQLDLICDTMGAMTWVNYLTWDSIEEFHNKKRTEVANPLGQIDLYAKGLDNFKFYWIMDAGHAAPKDQPETALRMLRRILDGIDH